MKELCEFLDIAPYTFESQVSNRSGNPKSKLLQKTIMRKSALKSLFVSSVPANLRKKIKKLLLTKNTGGKEKLSSDDNDFLNELYSQEIVKLKGSHQDDEFLRRVYGCLLYTSPSPRDLSTSRMPSSA